jgi:hypothetical protein
LDQAILGSGRLDDVFIDPWESSQPKIVAAWEALTRPENLADLEFWLASFGHGEGMNDWARKATLKAIEVCRARAAVGG